MRIYQVNAKVMWQCSYNEVLDAIRHAHRPVVVVFVNIDGPTCCDSIEELKDTSIQELKDTSIQEQQQLYRRHMYQLDAIDTLEAAQDMRRLHWVQQNRHLNQFQALVAAKVLRMNRMLADLANHSVAWHHRIADLNHDRQRLFKRHFKDVQKEYQQEDRRRQLVQREVAYMRQHVKMLAKAEKKMKKTAKLKPSKTDTRISTLREKLVPCLIV
ncbi:hypothetical protein DYB30_008797 [Aphanomyces astaci]|uniref:Uncharacterized protein n=1 Tax=Aphanomyces astaci TaxID=112090 RepID=A0A397EJ49_APHAT|nr:hypothetical protein DYB30_008797 [Aphanomyces astaci]